MKSVVREYALTEREYEELLEASRSVPYLVANGTEPMSPEQRSERIWQRLGNRHGFQWETVRPSPRGDRFFLAVDSE